MSGSMALRMPELSEHHEAPPIISHEETVPEVQQVGYQTWTKDNWCVDSHHNDIHYYTSRWDALCPYIDVSHEMMAQAPRPFVVYALPPDSQFGVPINDKYGLGGHPVPPRPTPETGHFRGPG